MKGSFSETGPFFSGIEGRVGGDLPRSKLFSVGRVFKCRDTADLVISIDHSRRILRPQGVLLLSEDSFLSLLTMFLLFLIVSYKNIMLCKRIKLLKKLNG